MSFGRPTGVRPRAGGGGESLLALLLIGALISVSPVALIAAAVTMVFILLQRSYEWWVFCLWGVGGTAYAFYLQFRDGIDPVGNQVHWQLEGATSMFQGDLVGALIGLICTSTLGLPAGIAGGALLVPLVEHAVGRAEWHPLEQRRVEIKEDRVRQKARARAVDVFAQEVLPSPPIAVALDGSLSSWVLNGFVVLPQSSCLSMAVIGGSGTGKTVTVQRIVMSHAAEARKVVLIDLKGTDPNFADAQVAAYLKYQPQARVMRWPEEAIDMWRGSVTEVANRLLEVHEFTEPYYEEVAQTVVRLALSATAEPCRDDIDFLARLNIDYLKRAHLGGSNESDVRALMRDPGALDGVRLRYSGYFKALDGRFDGDVSYDDFDLMVLTIPSLAAKRDASAYVKMLLADFSHFCTVRKPREGQDVSLIIDEFSAVPAAAPLVIDLGERIRDVGGQVIVTAQSYQGLGDNDDERQRLIDASRGGLIVHAQRDPEKLLEAAGTTRRPEQSWQLDEQGGSGMGSMRMGHRMAVDPDQVRKAGVGEAWAIANGKYVHMQVLPVPRPPAGYVAPARRNSRRPPPRPANNPPPRPANNPPPRPANNPPPPPKPADEGGDPFDA